MKNFGAAAPDHTWADEIFWGVLKISLVGVLGGFEISILVGVLGGFFKFILR